jgi:hypothetical protein
VAMLGPAPGDNTARLQQAIDMVGARTPDARGLRGALLLQPGTYDIAGIISIKHGGVVLRGSGAGADPMKDTILHPIGDVPHQRTPIIVGNNDTGWPEGAKTNISTAFVPVSGMTFDVESAAGLAAGDNVIIHHPSTAAWITAVEGGGTGKDPPWSPGQIEIVYNRRIARLAGNTVTLDAPLYYQLDRAVAQAWLAKTETKAVHHVGLENLRIDVQTLGGEDENHAWSAVGVAGAHDAWVRGVTALHWGYAGIRVQGSVRVTLADSRLEEPVAIRTGGRMYNISMDRGAQLVLVQNCITANGRHALVANGTSSASGIVYHRCTMINGNDVEAGHRMWVQGVLYDNVVETMQNSTYILMGNRGDWGTQHGWAAVHSVVWNFNKDVIIQKPPTAQNYVISTAGKTHAPIFPGPEGSIEIMGPGLAPASLYEAQLCERLRP